MFFNGISSFSISVGLVFLGSFFGSFEKDLSSFLDFSGIGFFNYIVFVNVQIMSLLNSWLSFFMFYINMQAHDVIFRKCHIFRGPLKFSQNCPFSGTKAYFPGCEVGHFSAPGEMR